MLARRRRLATAIEQSIESGRLPSVRELRAWEGCDDGAVQLGFVPLLVESMTEQDHLLLLGRQIADERGRIAELEQVMRSTDDPDLARCDALRAIRRAHPDERILCFAELATTVRAYHSALRWETGIGMLTASEARIASGRLARDELLARFAPAAQGASAPNVRERVTLLLTTDLLSEGVNLQDASVVVHLDLPWNPARLTQRVGRVRRAGGAAVVHSYLFAPPTSSELLLRVEERLRRKATQAANTIGATLPVIPVLTERTARTVAREGEDDAHSATDHGNMLEQVGRWRHAHRRATRCHDRPIVAGVKAARCGWLAALSDRRLMASFDDAPPDDESSASCAVALAAGHARPIGPDEASRALAAVRRSLRARDAMNDAGVAAISTPLCRAMEQRVANLLLRAPRHVRGALLPSVAALRQLLRRPPPLGAEQELTALMGARVSSAEEMTTWLHRMCALLGPDALTQDPVSGSPRVVALILIAL
jgi:hypothetical protein